MVARIGNNNQNFINGVNPTLRSVSPSTDNAIMPKMKNPRFNPEATIADVVACWLFEQKNDTPKPLTPVERFVAEI